MPGVFKKIIWALDPHDPPSRFVIPLQALRYFVKTAGSSIQPVYIVSSPPATGSEKAGSEGGENTFSIARQFIEQVNKDIYLQNLLRPIIVQSDSSLPHQPVDSLAVYAEESKADLIVTNSHGWSGMHRLLRGSFVESLLPRTSIPVLTLGPQMKELHPFDRILYATHLDRYSRKVLRSAATLAVEFHSELNVLHLLSRQERELAEDNSSPMGASRPQRSYLLRRSRAWTNWSTRLGISTEVLLEEASGRSISDQIVRLASRRAVGLILLELRSGPLPSFLKGSTIRNVIRQAECPVLVQRISGRAALNQTYSRAA